MTKLAAIRSDRLLSPTFSIYLDLLRFMAAFAVVVDHGVQDGLYHGDFPLTGFAHASVVVFFVLSGLVIAATSTRPGQTARDYAIARATRIYSVALPAIVFSFLIAAVIITTRQGPIALEAARETRAWSAVSSLLFLNQSWTNSAEVPLNRPYWSLCYEVWYYVLFGVAWFVRGRWRLPLVALAAIIAGPAVIALLPVWALGAWLALDARMRIARAPVGLAVLIITWAAFITLNDSGWREAIAHTLWARVPGWWRLREAQGLVTDYALGVLVAANFVGLRACEAWARPLLVAVAPVVRYLAGATFSLYLFHRPLVKALVAYDLQAQTDPWRFAGLIGAVVVICLLLATLTERRRATVRRAIAWLFDHAMRVSSAAR